MIEGEVIGDNDEEEEEEVGEKGAKMRLLDEVRAQRCSGSSWWGWVR